MTLEARGIEYLGHWRVGDRIFVTLEARGIEYL